jgi:hypothetical protein
LKESDYSAIAQRNPFRLLPERGSSASQSGGTFRPPPDYKLLGFVEVRSLRRVFLMRADPGKPSVVFGLAEGQKEGDLEIVEINAKAKTVRIRNEGIYVQLSFETHGLKDPVMPSVK